MKRHILAAAAISLVGWVGCGDGAGAGATAGRCQSGCQKATACGGGGDVLCSGGCVAYFDRWRAESRDAYFNCYLDGRTTNCAKDAENCLAPAQQAATPRPIDASFRRACLDRRTACMSSFPDDNCLSSSLYESSVVDQANACLAKPCAEISACIRAAFGG